MPSSNPRYAFASRRREIRKRVLAYYDTCAICGKPVDKSLKTPDPMSAEVDEIIPVSRGGSPIEWGNVQLTHRRCNRIKSNKSLAWARHKLTGAPLPKPRATSVPFTTSGL
ncbi:MAG: HNH endonuclease [Bifidobacteriaceae bacterium]|jgi:5-methylcytosine-specific restriction endonuclease McrA|nr:HNH endonuclease [Bifidobacteriaceae bacterium]